MIAKRVVYHYERPGSYHGYELDIPEELLDGEHNDELDEFVCDNAPVCEAYVEDWDWL